MCKVSTSTVVWRGIIKSNHNADSTSVDIASTSTKTIVSAFTVNNLVWYEFNCNIIPVYKGWNLPYDFYFYNGSTILSTKSITWKWDLTYSTWYIEWPNSNVSLSLTCRIIMGSSYTGTINNWVLTYYYKWNITISKTVKTRKSLPRELKSLWNKCKTTLFGYHIDDSWYEWA